MIKILSTSTINKLTNLLIVVMLLVSFFPINIARADITTGLIGYWKFDEASGTTASDSAGATPGTLINNPAWTTGKVNNGLQFSTTDDGNDANDPRVNLGTSFNVTLPFTISAWINPTDYNDYRAIFSKRDSYSSTNMRFDVGSNAGTGQVYAGTASSFVTFTHAPPINTWTNLTLVLTSSGTSLYVNGNLSQTLGAITLGTDTTANTVIGGTGEPLSGGDNDPFKGKIDEVRVYSRALSASDVTEVYNFTGGGSPPPPPPSGGDTTAPVISNISSSSISQTGATVSWTTNETSDTQIDYGTTTSYGSQTTLNSSLVTGHSQTISGLSASTLYNYRVRSKDAAGNLAVSSNNTFTTSSATTPPPPTPPPSTPGPIPPALGWYQIPNSTIRSVCPSGNFGNCEGVTAAWNSAVMDTTRNRMLMWGGGHGDYSGNEIYSLDLNTLSMSRLTDPAAPSTACPESLAGGTQPNARHTYDGMEYIPTVDKMFVFGGALSVCGNASASTWLFNFANNQWESKSPGGTRPRGIHGIVSAFDSSTGKVFVHDDLDLYAYTPSTDSFQKFTTNGSGIDYHMSAVVDPVRRKFIIFGGGQSWIYDISGSGYTKQTFSTTGGSAIVSASSPGLAYDPVSDRVVAWTGGNTVYSLNMSNNTWTPTTYSGGAGSAMPTGTFGRWQYSPSSGVFVTVNDVDNNAYSLRLTSGGTTPPPSPPAFNYGLTNSGNVSVTQGSSVNNTITNSLVSGTTQAVTLSASGLPSGAAASFSPASCSPNCSSIMTITTSGSTPTGTYTITVTGSGGATRTTSFSLTVNAAPSGGTSYGLEWTGNLSTTRRMLYWSNPFPIYDATYIFKVYPRQKTYSCSAGQFQSKYYTTFFWGNNGDFVWNGGNANTYYGAHPYPSPAPCGEGSWEISVASQDITTGQPVQWNRWYTQAFRAWRESSTRTRHEFYYDLPDTSKVLTYTVDGASWASQNPPNPAIVIGQAPDRCGPPPGNCNQSWGGYSGWEEFNGIIRGIQMYSNDLSVSDILAEVNSPKSTTAGQSSIWYLNLDPRPTDVTDKKAVGTAHNPSWDGTTAIEWTSGSTTPPPTPPAPPTVTSISPSSVTSNVATNLTVNGTNFASGFTASVTTPAGTFPLSSGALTFISATQLQAQVTMGDPATGQNSYSATLTITSAGQSATGNFTVNRQTTTPPPTPPPPTGTLQVGLGKTYTTIGAALTAAQSGNVIEIDAGIYPETLNISKSNITLKGVGGYAHLRWGNGNYQTNTANISNGKGIFIISGSNITLENLEFSGAKVVDENGAGVRYEGGDLTIRGSYFHDNENGILGEGGSSNTLLIENSIFERNGWCPSGGSCAHNLYIGPMGKLIFRHNKTLDSREGHTLKSRAFVNEVYGNFFSTKNSDGSYEADFPWGGTVYFIGNVIEQGTNTGNPTMLSFAEEGSANPNPALYVINNTFYNYRGNGTLITGVPATSSIKNNIFAGGGTTGTVDSSNKVLTSTAFVNSSGGNYRLASGSSAIDGGVSPGTAGTYNLTPQWEYVEPAGKQARVQAGSNIDAGAYEFASGTPTTPTITSFTASPSSITTGQSSTLSWSVSDATSLSINQGIGTVTGTTRSVSPTVTTTYTLTATNAQGSVTAQATVTVTLSPDTTAPTASITAPTAGTVSATITYSATASDPTVSGQVNSGINLLSLFIDGSLYATTTTSSISRSLNTTALSNGNHALTARAQDNAGNQFTTSAITINVNNAAAQKFPRTITLSSLEGLSAIPGSQSITVSIMSGSTVIRTQTLAPTSNNYTVTFQASDPQIVDVRVTVNKYLSRKLTSLDTTLNSASVITVPQLLAGDLNNDNSINTLDYSTLNSSWNQTSSSADINGDGFVNSLDYAVLKNNWNRVGE